MPKMKTNRAAAKRFKRTGTGKFKRARAYSRHHLQLKTRKQKLCFHDSATTEKSEKRHLQKLLPYGA